MTDLAVKIVAVHLECSLCGAQTRIRNDEADGFTRHVLQPLASWWVAHRDPQLAAVEVTVNGELQEWTATQRRSDR